MNVEIKVWVYAEESTEYSPVSFDIVRTIKYVCYPFPMDVACGTNRSLVGEQTVLLHVPDNFNPIPGFVETLKKAIQKERADSSIRINDLQTQINDLMMLGHDATLDIEGA